MSQLPEVNATEPKVEPTKEKSFVEAYKQNKAAELTKSHDGCRHC
jgi:hypothetical protein